MEGEGEWVKMDKSFATICTTANDPIAVTWLVACAKIPATESNGYNNVRWEGLKI